MIGLDDLDTSIPGIYRITYRVEKDYIDAEGRYMGMNAVDERTVIVKEKTEPLDPIDPESVDFEDDLNVAGVLSDESTSFDEKLSRLVETDLQKEWADAAKLNLFKRGYLFLSRGRKRRKLLKEKLRSEKSKIFDTEAVAQADRHDIERTLYDDG
ncbi:MAG: hypothetical protein LBI53_01430 [Candidatus Peribacteria bacterium]|nr:hypothetical protein [Candidatus Peribacteria bacterium]